LENQANNLYDFVVSLQRPGKKAINLVSQLLLVIFLFAFIWFAYSHGIRGQQLWLVALPVMIVVLWAYGYVRAADPEFVVQYRVELLIAAMGWLMLPMSAFSWWIGWGYAMMAILERFAKRPFQFRFTREKVSTNSLPPKHYEWFEIANVMIRDNLFTLDLNNNKMLQRELETPIDEVTQKEFNAYCKSLLHFNLPATTSSSK